jgi:cysteine desulfurase family protein (TIGR01976 family)
MELEANRSVFDVDFAREQFPFFKSDASKEWAFFDNAGGTFPCSAVIDRLTHFYRSNRVQPYGDNALAAAAGEQMDEGRSVMAELLGVSTETLTIGPSTTQNLNTLSIACASFLDKGDEIIVSEQDHEANIGGWERVARQRGATLHIWPANAEDGELDLADLEELLSKRTRIVCVTHCSNIVGTINPVQKIVRLGHSFGARVVIDGVSFAPHSWPDILSTGADVYCFSTYKTHATHLGVMYVASDFLEELTPQCHFFNVERNYARLDAAGPDHASIAALAGLGEFFQTLHSHHFDASDKTLHRKASEVSALMNQHEMSLCKTLLESLKQLPIRVIGRSNPAGREANISLVCQAVSSSSLASLLAKKGIATKNAHFYAYRLLKKLGVDTNEGVVRFSFAHYNTKNDVMRIVDALASILGE